MNNIVPIRPVAPEEFVMVCPCGCRTVEVRYNANDLAYLRCAMCNHILEDPDKGPTHTWFKYGEPTGDEPDKGMTTSVKVFNSYAFAQFWQQVQPEEVLFAALAMKDSTVKTWRPRKPDGADRVRWRSRMKEMLAMLLSN
jgi:hypothetical protein